MRAYYYYTCANCNDFANFLTIEYVLKKVIKFSLYHPHQSSAQFLPSKGEAIRCVKLAQVIALPSRGEPGRSFDEGDYTLHSSNKTLKRKAEACGFGNFFIIPNLTSNLFPWCAKRTDYSALVSSVCVLLPVVFLYCSRTRLIISSMWFAAPVLSELQKDQDFQPPATARHSSQLSL